MRGRRDPLGQRRRLKPFLVAITLLAMLQVTHLWLVTRAHTSANNRVVVNSGGEPLDVVPDDGYDVQSQDDWVKRKLENLRKRIAEGPLGRKSNNNLAGGLPPPPLPLDEQPTYDPQSVRPPRLSKQPCTPSPRFLTPKHLSGGTTGAPATGADAVDASPRNERVSGNDDSLSGEGLDFFSALDTFYDNLLVKDVKGNPEQPSKSFVDIDEDGGKGVALPYDPAFVEERANWEACDAFNASFSEERDTRCQAYLSNLNNMRYIKAMPSRLLQGRTIKMKIFYAHDNIRAIVKIAQRKFTYEAVSEVLAHSYDRALQFNRVPTTAAVPLPLDYLRAATSYSPLLSQWFHRFVVLYNYTQENFEPCAYHTSGGRAAVTSDDSNGVLCSIVAVQLWMKDVHPALETFLGLPYEFDENFAAKYYVPGHELFAGTKRARLRAIGELLDRSIFDFIIGNTDRGMNDHNNFVYGGCALRGTTCTVGKPENRIRGLAKYAYIDHGSSFHSHKEPADNPFFGDVSRIKICRFRRSTYANLQRHASRPRASFPLVNYVDARVPSSIYKVAYESVLKKTQMRLDKVLRIISGCLEQYPESEVFSLPEYDQIRIAEEDETLADE